MFYIYVLAIVVVMAQPIEAAKVLQWRQDNGLESDDDFKFVFTSHSEALANAGRAVADAWAICQGLADEPLRSVASLFAAESAAARTLPEPAKVSDQHGLWMARPRDGFGRVPKLAPRQVVSSSSSATSSSSRISPSAVSDLVNIMQVASKHREASDAVLANLSFQRTATQLLKVSEPITVSRALATWSELLVYTQLNKIQAGSLVSKKDGGIILDNFIRQSTGPSRALMSMKWLIRNLNLDIEFLASPYEELPPKTSSQAAASARGPQTADCRLRGSHPQSPSA